MHSTVLCSNFHHLCCSGGWASSALHPEMLKYSVCLLAAALSFSFHGTVSVRRPQPGSLPRTSPCTYSEATHIQSHSESWNWCFTSWVSCSSGHSTLFHTLRMLEWCIVALYTPGGSNLPSSSSLKCFFLFITVLLLKLLITNITAVFIFYPAFKQLEWYWSGCPQLVRHKAEHAPETDCYFKCYTFTLITSVFPLFLFHCFRLPSFTALVLFLFFIMFFATL